MYVLKLPVYKSCNNKKNECKVSSSDGNMMALNMF